MGISVSTAISRAQKYSDNISSRVDDPDWYVYFNGWLKKSAQDYNLPWGRRITQLLVYSGVYEYAVPADYRNIIEPQKAVTEETRNDAWFLFQTQKSFARNRNDRNDLAIAYRRETPFFNIRYDDAALSNQVLHDCNELADNGSWGISGGSNLAADANIFRQGSSSLRFDVTVAGTVTLTNSTLTSVDLDGDSHKNRAKIFIYVYLPVTGVTGVTLKWGSSASNYWSRTVSVNHNGSAFDVGWNLVGFEWNGATETGTVDEAAINYLDVALAGAAVGNGYHLDHIVSRMPKEFDLNYYSKNLVKDVGGSYKEFITANDDTILGDTEFEDCAIFNAVQQAARYSIKDADLAALIKEDFDTAFRALKIRHPDMAPRVQHSYINDKFLDF